MRTLLAPRRAIPHDGAEGAGTLRLHYGVLEPRTNLPCLWIRASTFFGDDYGSPRSLPHAPPGRVDDLPVLFVAGDGDPCIRRSDRRIETTADLVASAFFLLSGYEETVDPTRDEHGRMSSGRSYASRSGLLAEPLVDHYATILAKFLGELIGTRLTRPAWTGEGFALVPSHDVDAVRPPRRSHGRAETVADPILEIEARHAVKSTFFFLAKREDPIKERYDLGDRKARKALQAVRRAGSEVALHGSYFCLERPGELIRERDALQAAAKEPRGYRQHYLRLPQDGLRQIEQAGFRYDSSLGWADAIGFRNGTARPFHPYDFGERRALRLVEMPLVVMDRTLQKYLGLEPDAAWEMLERVLEAVRRTEGCASVLWHPEFFDVVRHAGYDGLYEKTLAWLLDSGGKALTGKDAARAWKRHVRAAHDAHD